MTENLADAISGLKTKNKQYEDLIKKLWSFIEKKDQFDFSELNTYIVAHKIEKAKNEIEKELIKFNLK